MSYILEALKKADQERTAGHVPDLESVHESARPERRSYRWVWILVGLLVFNAVLMTLLATRETDVAGETKSSQMPLAAVEDDSGADLPPLLVPRAVKPVPAPVTSPAAARPAVQSQRPRVKVAKVAPETVSKPVVKIEEQPPASASETVAGHSGTVPEWDDLSLEFRSGFKMPPLDVHVYDTEPRRRFVLVNLKKYNEGDVLESGAVIEEILPDGIQLSYQGTRFTYRK